MTLSLAQSILIESTIAYSGNRSVLFGGRTFSDTRADSRGYYECRILRGRASDGSQTGGQVIKVTGITRPLNYNDQIYVRPVGGLVGVYQYIGMDARLYTRPDIAPRQRENSRGANPYVYARQIVDGKLFIAEDGSGNLTLKLASYSEPYINYAGTLYSLGRGNSQSNTIDLTSYVPAANLERIVLIYTDTSDNSDGVVSGSTRTINGLLWSTSDIQALIDDVPHQLCIPREVWRLSDAQTALSPRDFVEDLRPLFAAPQATSFPTTLTRNYLIPNNHQQIAIGEINTGGNQLIISGELILQ